mmetsp:Transcript_50442/g.134083  ORF Transcript_50442/g.134083 Transcript_50442/m.134083 type:complete len:189 (+) Transcript_50442:143-709(+)
MPCAKAQGAKSMSRPQMNKNSSQLRRMLLWRSNTTWRQDQNLLARPSKGGQSRTLTKARQGLSYIWRHDEGPSDEEDAELVPPMCTTGNSKPDRSLTEKLDLSFSEPSVTLSVVPVSDMEENDSLLSSKRDIFMRLTPVHNEAHSTSWPIAMEASASCTTLRSCSMATEARRLAMRFLWDSRSFCTLD